MKNLGIFFTRNTQLILHKLTNENCCTIYLAVLAKRQRLSIHVKHTHDVVTLGEGGKGQGLLPIVVEVATVGAVQPHVIGRTVAVVTHGPARDSHARSLVSLVLLHYEELKGGEDGIGLMF